MALGLSTTNGKGTSNSKDAAAMKKSSNRPRVGAMLRQAAGMAKSAHHRSEDLAALQERYRNTRVLVKNLETALKKRHAAVVKTEEARAAVSLCIAVFFCFLLQSCR